VFAFEHRNTDSDVGGNLGDCIGGRALGGIAHIIVCGGRNALVVNAVGRDFKDGLRQGRVLGALFTVVRGASDGGDGRKEFGSNRPFTDSEDIVEAFGHEDGLDGGHPGTSWVRLYGLRWERLGDERKLLGGEVCFHSLRHCGGLLELKEELEGVGFAVPNFARKMSGEPKHITSKHLPPKLILSQ